jgi:hypothetical protein
MDMNIENVVENTNKNINRCSEYAKRRYKQFISRGCDESFARTFAPYDIPYQTVLWWSQQDQEILRSAAIYVCKKYCDSSPEVIMSALTESLCAAAYTMLTLYKVKKDKVGMSDDEYLALTNWGD